MGRPARVKPLGPRAVGEILNNTGPLTAAQPKSVTPLRRRKRVKFPSRRCRAKGRADGRRMKTPRVKFTWSDQTNLTQDFRAGEGCFEDRAPAGAYFITHRKGRHSRAASRVHHRLFQRVV